MSRVGSPGTVETRRGVSATGYSSENGTPSGSSGTGTSGCAGSDTAGRDSTGSSIRTAASRALVPSRGTPLTLMSSSYTPVAPSARPICGAPRRGTVSRIGVCSPGASSPGTGVNCGVTASVPARPSSASRTAPSVVSGSPRWARITSSSTGSVPVFVSVPTTVRTSGPAEVTMRGLMSVSVNRRGPGSGAAIPSGAPGTGAARAAPVSGPTSISRVIATMAATGFTRSPPGAPWPDG